MRSLLATTLASLLTLACGDNGDMQITQTDPTSLDTGTGNTASSDSNTATSAPGSTTQEPTGTVDPTTGTPDVTSEPLTTTAPTSDTGDTSTAGPTTEAAESTSTGGGAENLMTHYGSPCVTDDDCKQLLGDGGICIKDILGVYALPGGYCSTYCQLPDQQTTYIIDAPDCTMMADCVGLMGFFEGCAHVCTDDAQCPREGYECRQMPQISNPDDPEFCLMTEDNMIPP